MAALISRQTLKSRKWILSASFAVVVLISTISAMVAIVVSNNRKHSERKDSSALQTNDAGGAPSTLPHSSRPSAAPAMRSSAAPIAVPAAGTNAPSKANAPSKGIANATIEPTRLPEKNATSHGITSATLVPTGLPKNASAKGITSATLEPTGSPISATANGLANATFEPTGLPTSAPANGVVSATFEPTGLPKTAPRDSPSPVNVAASTVNVPTVSPMTQYPTSQNFPTSTVTTFYAHADIPYNSSQTVILEKQMKAVPADAEFVVFVGDLRFASPTTPCVKDEFAGAASLFSLSHAPVFALIGDNDWSDCPNQSGGLQLWRTEFVGFESKHWTHTFDIKRHSGYPDNFAFVHKGTQFIGLNIVGGKTYSESEWQIRLTDAVDWTKEIVRTYQLSTTDIGRVVIFGHADPGARHEAYFQPLATFIASELKNNLPVLYLNGDGHKWRYQPSFYDQSSWLRIMVTGLGEEPLLKVTVSADGRYVDPQQAFAIDRRL